MTCIGAGKYFSLLHGTGLSLLQDDHVFIVKHVWQRKKYNGCFYNCPIFLALWGASRKGTRSLESYRMPWWNRD